MTDTGREIDKAVWDDTVMNSIVGWLFTLANIAEANIDEDFEAIATDLSQMLSDEAGVAAFAVVVQQISEQTGLDAATLRAWAGQLHGAGGQ